MSRRASTYRKERDKLREENKRLQHHLHDALAEIGIDAMAAKSVLETSDKCTSCGVAMLFSCRQIGDGLCHRCGHKQLADARATPVGSISITEHTAEVARSVVKVRAECKEKFAAMVRTIYATIPTGAICGDPAPVDGTALKNAILAKLKSAGVDCFEAMKAVTNGKQMTRQGKKWYVFLRGGIVMVRCSSGSVFEYTIIDDHIKATDWVEVESEASNE